ncbi:NifU family protein [Pinisolibacter aquiterrae]|jgi:Fe-S cluster biogenesis protein NfuA|uniref:NifU family protein n=1 Tax=Pinisolibacter aquiterrae TaxID=2815579 RepID=UPI001C3CC6F2|nr:NifU family protein [Pinisolibacter aquiterrae]MBV5266134.1 NifU family protein [Pinisolibacter aquiterrae]MCC8236222.1 NifU family protein [Pinisolibacter aquiterrae]
MFIETEVTPNPATLKFVPGRKVLGEGSREFRSAAEAAASPLAARLFGISGVTAVFFGADFVSVTKDGPEWQHLKPAILGAIMEFFMSGAPLLVEADTAQAETAYSDADARIVATVKQLLDERVRPAVAGDGGDITFHSWEDGIVYLTMRGACSGCPSSTATLRNGVQNLLKHFIPEVREVRAVS